MTQFFMILAICRRILLGGDESDRVTIVEKPAESQQICVCVLCCFSLPTQTKQQKPDPSQYRRCSPLSALVLPLQHISLLQ